MSEQRAKGSGSAYQRSRDGRWCATIEAPGTTASGGRRRVTKLAKPNSKKAADRLLRTMLRELEETGAAGGSRTTVRQWAEMWLEIRSAKVGPSTWSTDRSAIHGYIIPTIGHRRLTDLTPADIRAVATKILGAGLKDNTARRYHQVLIPMLKDASAEGYPVPTRVFLVDTPPRSATDKTSFPTVDALRVLEVAAELPHGSRWAAALLQGLRQAEALGLCWNDPITGEPLVDVRQRRMVLSWQLKKLTYLDRERETFRVPRGYEKHRLHGVYHLVRPKSSAGWRVQPLVPWMADALEQWRMVCPPSEYGLVWPRADGRAADKADDLDEWHAIQSSAGVGHPAGRFYGTHEARHTTATLLMELGVDTKIITAILGHSSIVVSRGYMHPSQDATMAALDQVAERLSLVAPKALGAGLS